MIRSVRSPNSHVCDREKRWSLNWDETPMKTGSQLPNAYLYCDVSFGQRRGGDLRGWEKESCDEEGRDEAEEEVGIPTIRMTYGLW